MAQHIYLVRHGQSDSNADGVSRGEHAVLTEKGHKEAAIVAERIANIGVDAVLASPYTRTIETATPIHTKLGLPLETNGLLVELRRPSYFVGKSRRDPEIRAQLDAFYSNFGRSETPHSDEETFAEFRKRSLDALAAIEAHPSERICVVTHGIFLRALFCAIHNGPEYAADDFMRTWRLTCSNTGISYVRKEEGRGDWDRGWHIVSWNDLAHLG